MRLEFDITTQCGQFSLNAKATLEGRIWGLFGPSGAGKTTFLNSLMGLEKNAKGRIVLNDKVLLDTAGKTNVPTHRRQIGCVFQDNRLFPHLTVEGNLRYAQKAFRGIGRVSLEKIVSLLELDSLLGRAVQNLSGGEMRRVAIGRALLASPELLLLDEPLTGVDSSRRIAILSYLGRISETLDLPILIVSHDLETLLSLTEQLLIFEQGRLVTTGRYLDVQHLMPHRSAVSSSGLSNVLHLKVSQAATGTGLLHATPAGVDGPLIKLPAWEGVKNDSLIQVGLSADDIALALAPVEHISMQNQIRGTIMNCTCQAHGSRVCVDIGVQLLVDITTQAAQDMHLRVGKRVWTFFKAHALRHLADWPTEAIGENTTCRRMAEHEARPLKSTSLDSTQTIRPCLSKSPYPLLKHLSSRSDSR